MSLISVTAMAQTFQVTKATASPASASPGKTVTLTASVEASSALRNAVVDLEVYGPSGARVAQTYFQGQNFGARQTLPFTLSYATPANGPSGRYTLMVGVFTAGWAADLYWDASAASFSLASPPVAVNGACGSSNGAALTVAPTAGLCTSGTASAVTGSGSWAWSCSGSNGGTTASCGASLSAPPPTAGQVPTGLPGTFFVGVGANPDQVENWIPASGVPWAMCYQYISSGVLPGQSWVTAWGTNYAFNYATSARAAGCIPELTYYQMVPTIGAEGAAAESAALINPAIMSAYFKDFTALMQQLRAFGSTAVVHVEPDMWGYMESISGNPASIAAAVASSGNADVGAYPDTVAGFGQALIHLRDLYAPNVVLAAHVSEWLWSLSTDPSLDVTSIAKNDAAFMTGIGNWDLYFTDVSDRDAAYYQLVVGDGGAHWWDTSNQKYPNFARLNVWAAAFTSAAQKRLVIWQIPIGNTVMDSCNNSNFHYQDNRDQYWLSNYPNNPAISELAQAGVIGLLFGAGNSGTTQNYDAAGDGITNPAPIDGNTAVSAYPDDDGGLLRLNAGNYYRSGGTPLH